MFYKQSRPRRNGEPGTTWSAYDHADTMADAVEAYKRCRKRRTFILTDNSPDRDAYNCVKCGLPLSAIAPDDTRVTSAYVDYSPTTKRAWPHHYTCGWSMLLGAIATSYSLAEAGHRLAAAEGAGILAEKSPRKT